MPIRETAQINTLKVAQGAGYMIPVDDDMYVKTQINGIQVDCLVDSGSQYLVISTEVYAMLKRNNKIVDEPVYDELNANGVGGKKVKCYGYIKLPVKLGMLEFEANFWIMDMIPNLIIGVDVCRKHRIKLDIANNRLEIEQRGIYLLKSKLGDSLQGQLEMAVIKWDQKTIEKSHAIKEKTSKTGPQAPKASRKSTKTHSMAAVIENKEEQKELLKVIAQK